MTDITSLAWGGKAYRVSQPFSMQGVRPDWYQYSANYGAPAGAHIGLDVAVPKMTPIYALSPGTVDKAGFNDSFRPNPVYIKAEDNPTTPINEAGYVEIYGHLWQDTVRTGQHVKPGDLIGYSGEQTYKGTMTPDGSGPHIHFELRKPTPGQTESGYTAVDPTNYLQGREGTELGVSGVPQGVTGDITGVISDIGKGVTILVRRTMMVVLGLVLLYIGVSSLLKMHTGVNIKAGNVARKVTNAAI